MRIAVFIFWLVAGFVSICAGNASADPAKIRLSWVVVPGELTPLMFIPSGVTRHEGKSYVVEETHFAAGPLAVTAFAAGNIDVAGFGYSTIASAIQSGGAADLRVIADVDQDGVAGWYTNEYMVRGDSPLRRVEDLKGHVLAVNAVGGLVDIPLRAMLRQHGLDDKADVTIVEIAPPNMKATLAEGKVDLIGTLPPFSMNPALRSIARTLFTAKDAMGPQQVSTLIARAEFIAKNRAALVDFLEDYIRAVRWFTDPTNHQAAVQILADFTKQPAALFDSWVFTQRDQYRNPNALIDPALLQANVDLLHKMGYVKAELDMRTYADASLVREAAARIAK